MPYIRTLGPGVIGILGLAGLLETLFHVREMAPGDEEMHLFWTTYDSTAVAPWLVLFVPWISSRTTGNITVVVFASSASRNAPTTAP